MNTSGYGNRTTDTENKLKVSHELHTNMIQFIIMLASLMGLFTTIVQKAFECLSLWRKENISNFH